MVCNYLIWFIVNKMKIHKWECANWVRALEFNSGAIQWMNSNKNSWTLLWENAKCEMNENTINNENAYTADTYTKHLTLYCSTQASLCVCSINTSKQEKQFIHNLDFAYFFIEYFTRDANSEKFSPMKSPQWKSNYDAKAKIIDTFLRIV